jgi:muconolactone delta-isomerase
MLHMVVMTHGPDTCAAAHPAQGEMARNARAKMDETSKKHQVTVHGAWVDPPGHVFYILADAPNAHAINNVMTDLQFFLWNTVDIHPIVTLDEAMPLAK